MTDALTRAARAVLEADELASGNTLSEAMDALRAALAAAPDAGYRAGWLAGRDAAAEKAADLSHAGERSITYRAAIRALTPPAPWAPPPEGER